MRKSFKKVFKQSRLYMNLGFILTVLVFQSCNKDELLISQDPFEGSEVPREILYEAKDWYDVKMKNYEDSDPDYYSRFIDWKASSVNYIEEEKYWVLSVPLLDKSIITVKKNMQLVFYKTSLGLKGIIIEEIQDEGSSNNETLVCETNIYTIWGEFINSTQRDNQQNDISNDLATNMRLSSGESGGGGCPSGLPPGTICLDEVVIMGSRWIGGISYLWTITPPSYYPGVNYSNVGINHFQWFDGNNYVSGSGVNIDVYNTNQNQSVEITEQMLISILEGTVTDNTTNLLSLINSILSQYEKAHIKGITIAKVISDRNGEFELYLEVGKIDRIEKDGNEIRCIFQGKKIKFPVMGMNIKLDQDNNFTINTMTNDLIYIDIYGVSFSFFDITAIRVLSSGIEAYVAGSWIPVADFD